MEENNKSVNDHIEEYLDYYCNLSHAPNYAVLLKGEWGSGKTWFIKKYCEKLKNQKQKCLYVSLYGMAAFSDIEDALFQQLHPRLSSKEMAIAGKILKGLVKVALKIDLNSDSREDGTISPQIPDINLPEYLKNTDKSILIFDDLERCKIDIGSVLGYINYFVEHQDLKVIIIANEDELLKLNSTGLEANYKVIKEKLIGKTFNIHIDVSYVLKSFIGSMNKSELTEFLFEKNVVIKDLYKKAEYKNLRSLKQIILDFERIYEVLPDMAKCNSELLNELLELLIVFSIEVKRGNILPKDISNLKKQYYSKPSSKVKEQNNSYQQTNSHQNNSKQDENLLQNILDRYPMLNLYQPLLNEAWWQSFFDQGSIDVQELKTSVLSSRYFQDENTPNWMRLWHFSDLTDNEFDKLLEKVELEYTNRELSELGEIKHITGIFLELSEMDLYDKLPKDILQDAKSYIDSLNSLKDISLIDFNSSSFYNERSSYKGLGFFGSKSEEFKEFCDYIDSAVKKAIFRNMPNAGQQLLDTMQNDVLKFYRMVVLPDSEDLNYSDSQGQMYYEVPILKHIQSSIFVDTFLNMSPKDKRFVCFALKRRYKFDSINEKLIEEYDWLKSVRDFLISKVNNQRGKLSKYWSKILIEDHLKEAIKKLEAINLQVD